MMNHKWLWLLAAAFYAVFCLGCAAMGGKDEPNTEVRVGHDGVRFYDSKDNDIEVAGLEVDPATKRFKCDKLTIRNNASDVRKINVEQMDAFNRQLDTHGRNIERIFNGLDTLATVVAPLAFPGATLKGPLGGSLEVNSAATQALIEALAPGIEKLVNGAIEKAAREGRFKPPPTTDSPASAPAIAPLTQ